MHTSTDEVADLYRDATPWSRTKTMEHSSGIWGRMPMFLYLHEVILRRGQTVVDVGCGTGCPTLLMWGLVRPGGKVLGFDQTESMLDVAKDSYRGIPDLEFQRADITQKLPLEDGTADVVTSFMVINNLYLAGVQGMFAETSRILKPGGRAVHLMVHPDAFNSPWKMNFLVFEEAHLQKFRLAEDKQDIKMDAMAHNCNGGRKPIFTIHHTRQNVSDAVKNAGLSFVRDIPLWIDPGTAKIKFGENSIEVLPRDPMYWIIDLEKVA